MKLNKLKNKLLYIRDKVFTDRFKKTNYDDINIDVVELRDYMSADSEYILTAATTNVTTPEETFKLSVILQCDILDTDIINGKEVHYSAGRSDWSRDHDLFILNDKEVTEEYLRNKYGLDLISYITNKVIIQSFNNDGLTELKINLGDIV